MSLSHLLVAAIASKTGSAQEKRIRTSSKSIKVRGDGGRVEGDGTTPAQLPNVFALEKTIIDGWM